MLADQQIESTMSTARTTAITGILGGVAVVGVAFVLAMRTNFAPVVDRVRRFNRDVNNPRQLRTAGQEDAYASIVHHVGRTSGRAYRTPVVPVATDDGFVIPLPYGPESDWARNVLAAGDATITHAGADVPVTAPRVRSLDQVRAALPSGDRLVSSLFGIDAFLEVTSA